MRRDKYEYQLRTLRVPMSLGGSADWETHKTRRAAMGEFFGKRTVQVLEPMIREKVGRPCSLIRGYNGGKEPVNLSDAYFALANDVVSNYSFGKDSGLLGNMREASRLRYNGIQLLYGIKVNANFPWLIDLLESLPMWLGKKLMPPGILDMMELSSGVRSEITRIPNEDVGPKADDEHLPAIDSKRSIFRTLLHTLKLPPHERTGPRLEQEGTLLVLAGSESVAKALFTTHYYLLAKPSILSTLRTELATIPSDATWSQLEQLPYLSAVIEEGNRLSYGLTARTARIAYEPLAYTASTYTACPGVTYTIPPGTPVSSTAGCVHMDESVFPDPHSFKPERWLDEEGKERRKFNMAFNKGGRKCIGIELAHAELYLALAAVVREFDMELYETDVGDVEFRYDYQVAQPRMGSKGVRAMVR